MAYKVYVWTNCENGKKYVGTTKCKSLENRAGIGGYYYQGSPCFYSAIKKYGFDKFHGEILKDGLTRKEAAEVEKHFIREFHTCDASHGYNLQEGGFPDCEFDGTERARKISKTLKATRSTPAYREIMRQRALTMWEDPSKRAAILAKRAGKYTGRSPVSIFWKEANRCFSDLHKASKVMGISISTLSKALSGTAEGEEVTKYSRKHKTTYTVCRTTNVHVKESELLEASAGNAGGNQQPCAGTTQAAAQ